MRDTGMYGGTFNPIHLGHVGDIIQASCMCKKLYVVLSVSETEVEIDGRIRYMWLKDITRKMPNVEVVQVFDNSTNKEVYDWETGRDDILAITGPLDVVFCGDDYKGRNLFEKLYPKSKIHYFSRKEVNISSTQIRKNPYKYFEFLPNIVKEYYTKKVIVVGTESCGKSTLVRNLAMAYNTTYVEEVGRDVCEDAGGIDNMMNSHFEEIIYKHKVREKEEFKRANKVLFIDTDALITLYYYRLQYGDTKEYKETFANLAIATSRINKYDLWLFLEPDVEWVQDGTRTYGEDKIRHQNNMILKKMLDDLNIKYECIGGNYQDRFIKSKLLVDNLLN